ncbi:MULTISPECIES: hypothetical protein [unclassified Allomuricauda]|jgi:hypothetical protein|uniref:hypothetical protein n=1 Tax=unclassified Allomuricauda TaxID=2615049 RepID=UPI00273FB9F7|nr:MULTISPECIES: hypothetical protein [unclassified Allomuricauda]
MDRKSSQSELKQEKPEDFWNLLPADLQQEIKNGLAELDQGKRISYESFVKKISRQKYLS